MRNTGIIYSSTDKTPVVLPELAGLLPPLTGEQLSALEADILQNGCYSPVIVNEDLVIVDGHNRQSLCEKHGIPYQMAVFHFDDTLEAMKWAVDTQKARRNLSAWELGKIALKLKPEVEAKGKANMSAGGGDQKSQETRQRNGDLGNEEGSAPESASESGCQNSGNPISDRVNTRKQLANTVGISHDTMSRIMKIDEQAPDVVKEALDSGEISVNTGYNITRDVQNLPEEEREQAAELALAMRKAQKELQAGDEEINRKTKISQNFSKLYRMLIHLKATQEDVDCWVECCRMTPGEIQNNLTNTRNFIEKFSRIAELLEAKLPPEDASTPEDADGEITGGADE